MILIKYESGGEENYGEELKNDGLHLPGLDVHLSETLCGACDTLAPYEYVDGVKPTCKNCISAAKQLFSKYNKKQVNEW